MYLGNNYLRLCCYGHIMLNFRIAIWDDLENNLNDNDFFARIKFYPLPLTELCSMTVNSHKSPWFLATSKYNLNSQKNISHKIYLLTRILSIKLKKYFFITINSHFLYIFCIPCNSTINKTPIICFFVRTTKNVNLTSKMRLKRKYFET